MPWIRFTDNFSFSPTRRVTIAYKANNSYLVSQACAEAAIKAGKAEKVERAAAPSIAAGRGRRGEYAGG